MNEGTKLKEIDEVLSTHKKAIIWQKQGSPLREKIKGSKLK